MDVEDAAFTPYHRGRNKRDKLDKSFVAWDGEGITPIGELRQNYVLFGNSDGFRISGQRLGSYECLSLILNAEIHNPNAIHCGFAFSYDVEMILADLPLKALATLRRTGNCFWSGFRIEFKRGKWFQVGGVVNRKKVSCRIWDIWGFFQSSFVAAIKSNIGDIPELAEIEAGKSGRKQFTYDDLNSGMMNSYMSRELEITVKMMDDLRARLFGADMRITQWHGPGAIASHVMKRMDVPLLMDKDVPPGVGQAAQYGFAGGRFELFRLGHHDGPVYAYDIRSAYPSAIVDLPDLAAGSWSHVQSPQKIARVGIYRIRFRSPALMSGKPMPFFYRDPKYRVHFPNVCEGWYWSPEAELTMFLGNDAEIVEGYVFSDDGSRPFAWVGEKYELRAQWKRDGNPSEKALKLLLNSMYGKFAQRVGWEKDGKSPAWHQLEWAGLITSTARAKIFRAMVQAYGKGALLGVETDGIFSAAPLDLDLGEGLGQWELSEYDAMIYLQSGFYFKRNGDSWSAKYRGFDKGCISQDDALAVLRDWKPWNGDAALLTGQTTRFSSMGQYLRMKNPQEFRNRWVTADRVLSLGAEGKRVHRPDFCPQCKAGISPADEMHTLTISNPIGGMSIPHNLPWITEADNPYRSERSISHDTN